MFSRLYGTRPKYSSWQIDDDGMPLADSAYCEYCGTLLESGDLHPYGDTYYSDGPYCPNDDCCGETQYCDACGEALKWDNELLCWQRCECESAEDREYIQSVHSVHKEVA